MIELATESHTKKTKKTDDIALDIDLTETNTKPSGVNASLGTT